MELIRYDAKLVEGEHLDFEDKGKVSKGSKTHKYAVTNKTTNALVGYVKLRAQWRWFVFEPFNCTLTEGCLREAADFCRELNKAHREKRQPFPSSVEETVVEGGASHP